MMWGMKHRKNHLYMWFPWKKVKKQGFLSLFLTGLKIQVTSCYVLPRMHNFYLMVPKKKVKLEDTCHLNELKSKKKVKCD